MSLLRRYVGRLVRALQCTVSRKKTGTSTPSVYWPDGNIAQFKILNSSRSGDGMSPGWWNASALTWPNNRFESIFTTLKTESNNYAPPQLEILEGETCAVFPDCDVDPKRESRDRGAVVGLSEDGPFVRNGFHSVILIVVRKLPGCGSQLIYLHPGNEFSLSRGDRVHVGLDRVIHCPL